MLGATLIGQKTARYICIYLFFAVENSCTFMPMATRLHRRTLSVWKLGRAFLSRYSFPSGFQIFWPLDYSRAGRNRIRACRISVSVGVVDELGFCVSLSRCCSSVRQCFSVFLPPSRNESRVCRLVLASIWSVPTYVRALS